MNAPILYDVERIRYGRSFCARRVVAIQHGRPIFNMSASFQVDEEGLSHQVDMPGVPTPDELRDDLSIKTAIFEKEDKTFNPYTSPIGPSTYVAAKEHYPRATPK